MLVAIQIALTVSQREDAKVRTLLDSAEQYDDRKTAVHAVLVHSVHDRQVRRLLIDSFRLKPEASITLYDVLKARMDRLAQSITGDDESLTASSAGPDEGEQQEIDSATTVLESILSLNQTFDTFEQDELATDLMDVVAQTTLNWDRLCGLILLAAERLWRDHFVQYRTEQEARQDWKSRKPTAQESGRRFHLTLLTQQAHSLMLLWLESSLYRLRAVSNSQARKGVPMDRPSIGSDVQAEIKNYLDTLDGWDQELHALTGVWYFRKQFGDGQRLRVLSAEFGPSKVDAREKGWAPAAPDAHDALRYAYFDVLRKESIRSHKPFAAVGYSALWFTTGYGTRPMRFTITALAAIIVAALTFFLNDFFNPGITNTSAHFCKEANVQVGNWSDVPATVVHYLYLAITNLSSLGSDSQIARYCGGTSTQIILALSAITGYFFLAVLASLFFQLLTERD